MYLTKRERKLLSTRNLTEEERRGRWFTFIAFGEHVVNEPVAEKLCAIVRVVTRGFYCRVEAFQLVLALIELVTIVLIYLREKINQVKLLKFIVTNKD